MRAVRKLILRGIEILAALIFSVALVFLGGLFAVIFYFLQPSENLDGEIPAKSPHRALFMYMDQVDEIDSALKNSSAPTLCEIICNLSAVSGENSDLYAMYKADRKSAFEDPEFRLRLERAYLMSQIFPRFARDLFLETLELDLNKLTATDRAVHAVKLEASLLPEIFPVARRIAKIKETNQVLEQFKNLKNQCGRKAAPQLKQECLKIIK